MDKKSLAGQLVVMQPTVLPWAGYFNLMYHADDFVFLDDVQLEKQSWQTRNRLLFQSKPAWIILPISHRHDGQSIAETRVVMDQRWTDKFRRSFDQNYAKHPYKQLAGEILNVFLDYKGDTLAGRNEATIRFVCDALQLAPRFHRASDLNIGGVRSDRLIAFCRHFSAQTYLSPVGSADYLEADGFAARSPAKLVFQDYKPLAYRQATRRDQPFESQLSIVDVVANLGWERTRMYVIQGYVDD